MMFTRFREPVSTITHLIGAFLAVGGLIWLIVHHYGDPLAITVGVIFSLGCILTFVASTVMHGYIGSKETIRFLNKLDHCAIYLMIAGSYTPILVYGLADGWRTLMLIIVWGMALWGIVWKLWFWQQNSWASVVYYVSTSWVALAVAPAVIVSLSPIALGLMVAGGLTYLAGAVVFTIKRPNLNRWWGHHELWHLFVLGGCALHYTAIVFYIC